jgi:glutaredoxin
MEKGMEITVYGKETCGNCKEFKDSLKELIKKYNLENTVKFTELDIEKSSDALADYTCKFNTTLVPVIVFKNLKTQQETTFKGWKADFNSYLEKYLRDKEIIRD